MESGQNQALANGFPDSASKSVSPWLNLSLSLGPPGRTKRSKRSSSRGGPSIGISAFLEEQEDPDGVGEQRSSENISVNVV
jgi:hypothetical protein